jgi:hypothetical protein
MDSPKDALLVAAQTELGKEAIKQAEEFLSVALAEPAKSVTGFLVTDRVNFRRYKNLIRMVVEAKHLLEAAGLSATEVPLKIIHPLLEAASVEEDEDIQKIYSTLLAGASSADRLPFIASYVDILRQLSPEEARLLKLLYARLSNELEAYTAKPPEMQLRHPFVRLGTFEELKPLAWEAAALTVTEENESYCYLIGTSAFDNLCRLGILRSPSMGQPNYGVTSFGYTFLVSCCHVERLPSPSI